MKTLHQSISVPNFRRNNSNNNNGSVTFRTDQRHQSLDEIANNNEHNISRSHMQEETERDSKRGAMNDGDEEEAMKALVVEERRRRADDEQQQQQTNNKTNRNDSLSNPTANIWLDFDECLSYNSSIQRVRSSDPDLQNNSRIIESEGNRFFITDSWLLIQSFNNRTDGHQEGDKYYYRGKF